MADILLVAATEKEASFLISKHQKFIPGEVLSLKGLSKHHYDLLITGPGITATTYFVTRQLLSRKYDLVINIGICGSLDPDMSPVKVVRITTDQFGDFGAENNKEFKDIFELNLIKPNSFPFKRGKLHQQFKQKLQCLNALTEAEGITVQKTTGSKSSIKVLQSKYGKVVESMEGAAFFYCCSMEGVASLQIRAISNMVEVRDKSKWKIDEAIDALEGVTGLLMMEIESTELF